MTDNYDLRNADELSNRIDDKANKDNHLSNAANNGLASITSAAIGTGLMALPFYLVNMQPPDPESFNEIAGAEATTVLFYTMGAFSLVFSLRLGVDAVKDCYKAIRERITK